MSRDITDIPHFGLKITTLACTIALLTSAMVGGLFYFRIAQVGIDGGVEKLASQTRELIPAFQYRLSGLQADAFMLSQAPSIVDLIKVTKGTYKPFWTAPRINEKTKETHDFFLQRMHIHTSNILKLHPEYQKAGFVFIDKKWNLKQEIVRNNDNEFTLTPDTNIAPDELSHFYKESLKLQKKEYYISSIYYDHDQTSPLRKPSIKIAAPFTDDEGHIFGFVTISIAYEYFIKNILKIPPRSRIVIITENGDYMENLRFADIGPLKFHGDRDYDPPPLVRQIIENSTKNEYGFTSDLDGAEHKVFYAKIPLDEFSVDAEGRYIGIALVEPTERFVQEAYLIQRDSIKPTVVAIIISTLMAWPIAFWLNKHFMRLSNELGQSRSSEKKALSQLRAVIDNAADSLITTDCNGTILSANPASERIFNFNTTELIGENISQLLLESPFDSSEYDGYQRNNRRIGIGFETKGQRKNREIFPIHLYVSQFSIDGTVYYSHIIRDITVNKEYEDRLLTSNKALLKSNEELDDFAYIASHDLKEPLRAIYNHSQFLLEDYNDKIEEDGKKRLNRLMELTLRMEKLINDLLQFSRISRSEISMKAYKAEELIHEAIKNLDVLIEEKNAAIKIQDNLPNIVCDSTRVISIFQNLIVNGIKYNKNEQKIIEVGFLPHKQHDQYTELDVFFVRDNGIGIAAHFKDDVFRIFKRLNSPKLYGDGTGSGLTFTKKNVERHKGVIWLESTLGEGTTFYFTLKETYHGTK